MAGQSVAQSGANPQGYQPLVVVALAVCAGIVLERYVTLRAGLWWTAALVAWCLWLAAWRARHHAFAGGALLLCLAATGAAWHEARWSLFASDDLATFAREAAQPVCIEAVARHGPRRLPAAEFDPLRAMSIPDRSRLKLFVTRVRDGDQWRPAAGMTTLDVTGHVLGVRAGDRLQIFAQLREATAPMNPGEFDFAAHLRADRQLCRLTTDHPQCLTTVARGAWWNPPRWWDRARQAGDQALWNSLRGAQSGLAMALVLGEREELDAEATRHFYETGTVHLLSISGLHVGLLAMVLFRGLELGLLRRGPALTLVAAITTLYALVIDADPAAVRATVMVWLVCAALYTGRPVASFNLLAAAALVVLVMNPADLFRVGPQLSFLAVATLAWVGPSLARRPPADPLARLIAGSRPWPVRVARRMGSSFGRFLLLTSAVWLVTGPLVLSRFHLVSPAALLLTPLLTIPVALGLFTGFVLVSVGWLIWPLSVTVGWVCDRCLALVTGAVAAFDRLPASHYWLPGPPDWWLAGCYGMLGLWAVAVRLRPPRRWRVALLAGWTSVGLLAALFQLPARDKFDCTFLAVGHGCAAVMELPDGRILLYDAGQLGSPAAAARSISSFLWSRGRTRIDAVVISHADVDHFNALPELLRRFSVGVVYVSPLMFDGGGAAVETLRQAILRAGVPLREISTGDYLRGGPDCTIEVLHPPAQGTLGSDNANSIVLEVVYRGRRVLLPRDLESPGLDDLLADSPRDCDVILAPHHGSARSDPPGFVAWTTPEWAIISGDSRSNRPQVAEAYRRTGAEVLNTSQTGAVMVRVDRAGLRVSSWRRGDAQLPEPPWSFSDDSEDDPSADRN